MTAVPEDRLIAAADGFRVDVGNGRSLLLVDSPGHAKHHHAVLDEHTGTLLVGDAVGVLLPDLGVLRPATPPPDLVPMPPAKPAAPAVKPAPANVSYAGKSLGFKPVEAPPPPVSAQKEAELQALLARYMANQVSPDEYQKERAAILAEP